ncbi:MAG: MBOAT family O-acyltransferase [Fuerstiella sp.]
MRPALLDMLAGGVVLVTALLLVRAWLQVRLRHPPFALDHAVMLVFFAVFAEALSRLVCGVERLAGYDTSPPMRYALLAGSPAEFWWRWNHRVHGWLMLNVFRPCGGRSAPIRGLALTFLVSGIHHEAIFAVVTERIDGYQLMFFLLQIPAVAASPKLAGWWRQSGRAGRTIGWLVTVTWFYFTSMLFFHGVNRVFPGFYASETWLP